MKKLNEWHPPGKLAFRAIREYGPNHCGVVGVTSPICLKCPIFPNYPISYF